MKAWRPDTEHGSFALTIPYRGQQKMTRRLYETLLEIRLKELIDKNPKEAYNILSSSPELTPDLYEIATVWGQPKDWPTQILACGQMQMCLDRIDWSKPGKRLKLAPDNLPSLEEITSAL